LGSPNGKQTKYTDVIQVYCHSRVTGQKWDKYYAFGLGLIYGEGFFKAYGGDFRAFVEY